MGFVVSVIFNILVGLPLPTQLGVSPPGIPQGSTVHIHETNYLVHVAAFCCDTGERFRLVSIELIQHDMINLISGVSRDQRLDEMGKIFFCARIATMSPHLSKSNVDGRASGNERPYDKQYPRDQTGRERQDPPRASSCEIECLHCANVQSLQSTGTDCDQGHLFVGKDGNQQGGKQYQRCHP